MDVDLMNKDGAAWLLGVRPHTWRIHVCDYPSQALGHGLRVFGVGMPLLVFNLEPLFEQGVMMGDIHQYLDSPGGMEYASEHAAIIPLEPDACIFVPSGYLSTIMFNPGLTKNEIDNAIGYTIMWTVWSPNLAAGVSENLWKSIVSAHRKHLEKVKTNKLWTSRAEVFAELAKQAPKHRTS